MYKIATSIIQKRCPNFTPKIGIILGSGLGAIAEQITNPVTIPFTELPEFSVTNIPGHAKNMHLGKLQGTPVVCLEGRSHLYEGVAAATDSLRTMIRTLKSLGCETLLTTNAVGSLRQDVGPGSLMVIEDHINFMFHNVLMGPNADELGDRFTSMDNVYDLELRNKLLAIGKRLQIPLTQGVYLATSGPTFETHAEIRAYSMLGAHAVGMSTVPETMLARHCGMKVATVCAITNLAAGLSTEVLSHEGTLKGAKLAMEQLVKLFITFIAEY